MTASVGYELEIVGIDEALRDLERFPEIANKHLDRAMQNAVLVLQGEARQRAPVFMGALRGSIRSKVTGQGMSLKGVVGSALKEDYPVVMEFGRRPGAKMPPPQALERWVHLQMGVPTEDAPGVAYVVARSIGRKGIKGRFFMRRAYEENKNRVMAFFVTALDRITKELAGGG